ncbi:MAG: hypothetical protein ACPGO5_04250 [Patescibacteria group bacterium]
MTRRKKRSPQKEVGLTNAIIQKASLAWIVFALIKFMHARGALATDYTNSIMIENITWGVLGIFITAVLTGGEVRKTSKLKGMRSYIDQVFSWNFVHAQIYLYFILPELRDWMMYIMTVGQFADAAYAGVITAYRASRNVDVDDQWAGDQAEYAEHINPMLAFVMALPVMIIPLFFCGIDLYFGEAARIAGSVGSTTVMEKVFLGEELKLLFVGLAAPLVVYMVFRIWALRGWISYASQVGDHLVVTLALIATVKYPFLINDFVYIYYMIMAYLSANLNGPITEKALQRRIVFQ